MESSNFDSMVSYDLERDDTETPEVSKSPRQKKNENAKFLIKKVKLKKLVAAEKRKFDINVRKLNDIKANFRSSSNMFTNANRNNASRSPCIPLFREYNLKRPHAVHQGSLAYLIQNPLAHKHQEVLLGYRQQRAASADEKNLKDSVASEASADSGQNPIHKKLQSLKRSLSRISKQPSKNPHSTTDRSQLAPSGRKPKKEEQRKPYQPKVNTSTQGSLLLSSLKKKTLVHREVALSSLDLDNNMKFDFNKVKRDEIRPDILMKFKWRVIQKLMESQGPQIEMLLLNLKELIAEIKRDSNRYAKYVRVCRACRFKVALKYEADLNKKLYRPLASRKNFHLPPTGKEQLRLIVTDECPDADIHESSERDPSDISHDLGDEEEDQGLDITEFTRLFNRIGVDDQTLINKVFWIFDEDGSGDVDHKELAIGLEMLNSTTYEEKIGKFFDLCDEDNSGSIDKKEFYSLLKLNLNDYEDKKRLKLYVKEIFREYDYDGDGELDRQEMVDACSRNWKIKNLIESNVRSLKNIEKWIEKDFSKQFTTKISFCAGLTLNKNNNGVHHAHIAKMERAFEEGEAFYKTIKKAKVMQQRQEMNLRQSERQHEKDQLAKKLGPKSTSLKKFVGLKLKPLLSIDGQADKPENLLSKAGSLLSMSKEGQGAGGLKGAVSFMKLLSKPT